MRLLVLAPSVPFPARDGVHLRLQNLLGRLPSDWDLRLICFDRTGSGIPEAVEAPVRCELTRVPIPPSLKGWRSSQFVQLARPLPALLWKFRSDAMVEAVRKAAKDADAVLAVGLQMAQYLPYVPAGTPVALDNYNIESRVLERLADTREGLKQRFWRYEASKLRRAEQRLLGRSGTVFAISDVDRTGMAKMVPSARVLTVPMGIDLNYFQAAAEAQAGGPPRFAFVGAFNWHVNEAAAQWLAESVWPRVRAALPDAELCFVGRDPSPTVRALAAGDPSIQVTGTVADVRPYLRDSTALLVPLRYGSGVRTKILEAFAVRRPVVSTSVGCEGLPVTSGRHLLIADDEEAFANACVRIVRERAEADRMVDAAFDLVREQDQLATASLHRAFGEAFHVAAPSS